MPASRISTFDDWVDLFRVWRNDIGVNYPEIENFQFEAKFGPTRSNEIEFGSFKGRSKWRRVLENVLLPAEILGLPKRESRARARDLLEMVPGLFDG